MASNRRKSAAVVLALLGVAGLSLASASQLDVRSGTLQAGGAPVTDCDTTGVDVTYAYAWVNGAAVATGGTVKGFDQGCEGGAVDVTVTAGATVTDATAGAVPTGGGDVSFTLAAGVDASALSSVSVVVSK